MTKSLPVYVKLEQYRELLEIVKVLANKISRAEETISRINDLKEKEDAEVVAWQENLDEVKKRVRSISTTLMDNE